MDDEFAGSLFVPGSSQMSRSISSQKPDSSASSSTIPSLAMKSAFDFPRHAER